MTYVLNLNRRQCFKAPITLGKVRIHCVYWRFGFDGAGKFWESH
jgi:hypothetical protein